MAYFLKLTHVTAGKMAVNFENVLAFSPGELEGQTDIDLRDDKNFTVTESFDAIWDKLSGRGRRKFPKINERENGTD